MYLFRRTFYSQMTNINPIVKTLKNILKGTLQKDRLKKARTIHSCSSKETNFLVHWQRVPETFS